MPLVPWKNSLSPVKLSGNYMYNTIGHYKYCTFYCTPYRIYVSCTDLRANSDYFPMQN